VTSIVTTTVSPVLAALFVASDAYRIAGDTHQREVLDIPAPAGMRLEDRAEQIDHNNALNEALCEIHYSVAGYPAETMSDLKAKLHFMVKEQMGDGHDWLPTVLDDLQRIEPAETPDWSETLKIYEQTTTDSLAALASMRAAEAAHQEDPHVEAVRAVIACEARQDETCDAQCKAIRRLILPSAPSLSALLVNLQVAIDTGMIACPDLNDALATDLRRFSNYADREA
jgi:hypothetical protein